MVVSKIMNIKLWQSTVLLALIISLSSCGTYQSAYNDDGIYGLSQPEDEEIVIVEKSEFDQNYFTRNLRYIQNIEEDDYFTDIDSYGYDNPIYEDDSSSVIIRMLHGNIHKLLL